MQQSMARTVARPTAGLGEVIDDIERKDNDRGPEPEATAREVALVLLPTITPALAGWEVAA
ncbi:hypothetical protein [Streptomyces caniferus]|uniref:hypothetical protein n=1 Tax=Streptomyces caniferus TaxID=285557 RepID=UPI0038122EAE